MNIKYRVSSKSYEYKNNRKWNKNKNTYYILLHG